MLGAARAAARAIRLALVEDNIYAAQKTLNAYQGPSRLPLTALVHGTIRTHRPMAAAIAVESHLENAKSLRTTTLQAYISALTSSQPQIIPSDTAHTPVSAALTVLAAARRSKHQQRTTHMYDAAIRACLLQGEILTGSLLFVLLVRDWQNRHRDPPAEPRPPDPPPAPTLIAPSPLERWNRSFPTAFTSAIPPEAPTPPFPSAHLMEAIVADLDLRPRSHPQTTHDLPPGRPPDSILALAHLTRLFTEQVLPFSRHAALLHALARTPPMVDKVESYFHGVMRQTCRNPPLLDTRSYNVLIDYSLSSGAPPLRITDATRAIITRGEAKLRKPGCPPTRHPPAPPPAPVHTLKVLPKDPHLLAAYIHNLTSLGTPNRVLQLVNALVPNLHIPPTGANPRTQRTLQRVLELGPTVLTSLLNSLCKSGKTGLAERVHRFGVLAEQISSSFVLPLAFHTTILQMYARESRKGLTVIEPKPSPLAPPHKTKAIVDSGSLLAPPPSLAKSIVEGWGYDVPTPGGRTHRGIKRWALARSAAAHIYVTYIRPRLSHPSQDRMKYHPDARLYNALFDVFGRRPNMLLRTHLSNIARARDRRRRVKSGVPRQTDAFVQLLVKDMVEFGLKDDVPGGWSHFIPIDRATFDYSAQNVLMAAYRFRNPVVSTRRWRLRETYLRTRFRPHQRADLWRRLVPQRKQTQFLQYLEHERAKPQRRLAWERMNLDKSLRRDLAEGQKALDREIKSLEVDEYWSSVYARREEEKRTRKEMRRARAEMQRAIARFTLGLKDESVKRERVRQMWLAAQEKVKHVAQLKRKAAKYDEVPATRGRTKGRRRSVGPSITRATFRKSSVGSKTVPIQRSTIPPLEGNTQTAVRKKGARSDQPIRLGRIFAVCASRITTHPVSWSPVMPLSASPIPSLSGG
ncbi:hypothetical protein OPQ81_004011 [Rhizoctonia solani]|nr:hypothetical protein OPQ81_004011 [Rhizoctonia solani]